MPVCLCGCVSSDDARFCRDCGRALEPVGQRDVVLLSETAARSQGAVVTRDGWNRRTVLPLALLGLAALTLGIWTAGRGSDAGPSPRAPQYGSPPSTTTVPQGTSVAEPTLVPSPGEVAGTAPAPDDGEPGPVGYRLLVTTTGRPALVDLDSGDVEYAEGGRVFPVAVVDRWLVIQGETSRQLHRLPLDDLEAEPEPLVDIEDAAFVSIVSPLGQVDPGQLWVSVVRQPANNRLEETLLLVDLETGATVDERSADPYRDPFGGWTIDESAGLITGPTGGVYEADGGGYRRVTDGRVLAADDRRALVQTCDDELSCALHWLDRGTWQPLDLVTPDRSATSHVLLAGTDWLLTTAITNEGTTAAELLDIETGDEVEVRADDRFPGTIVLPAISPDGRWLAQHTDDPRAIELRDLTGEGSTSITLDEAATGPLFFLG